MSENLDEVRAEIDRLDGEILRLLAERLQLARRAAETKWRGGMPVVQAARMRTLLDERKQRSSAMGVPPAVATALWRAIFEEAHRWDMEARAARGAHVTDFPPGAADGFADEAVEGIDHLVIETPDVTKTVAWLRETLGARFASDETTAGVADAAQLMLGAVRFVVREAKAGGESGPPHLRIGFAARNTGLLNQDLSERGAATQMASADDQAECVGEDVALLVEAREALGVDLSFIERRWRPPE